MIPLAWCALGFLFADPAPAFPAGNLAPLTRAITALWRRLDRPVRSPTPQGPKGSVQARECHHQLLAVTPCTKGGSVSHPSVCCQSVSLLLDSYLLSHTTRTRRFGSRRETQSWVCFVLLLLYLYMLAGCDESHWLLQHSLLMAH